MLLVIAGQDGLLDLWVLFRLEKRNARGVHPGEVVVERCQKYVEGMPYSEVVIGGTGLSTPLMVLHFLNRRRRYLSIWELLLHMTC